MPEAGADRVATGLPDPPALAADADLAAGRLARAEQRHEELALALAGQAADAEDLAAPQRRARRRCTPLAAQVAHLEHGRRVLRRPAAARDTCGRSCGRSSASPPRPRRSRSRVATCSPLRKTVIRSARSTTSPQRCDVKMTHAPRSRSARTSPNSHSTSLLGERRGGLVEEEDLAARRSSARTISITWRCGERERRDELERVDPLDAELGEDLGGPRRRARAAGSGAPRPARLVAEQEVLGDRHPRHQRQLLEDGRRRRAPARRAGRERSTSSPLTRTTPSSGLSTPLEDLDHRALAGAVLADERVHLAEVGG